MRRTAIYLEYSQEVGLYRTYYMSGILGVGVHAYPLESAKRRPCGFIEFAHSQRLGLDLVIKLADLIKSWKKKHEDA